MVAGITSAKVAAGAGQEISPAEVAADAYPAENQDPEADGGPNDNVSLAPTDPEAPPMSVGQRPQQNDPTEAERMAQGWCESCVWRRGAACVDAAGITLTGDGRTRMRDTHNKRVQAIISSSKW